jgi:hypothetical protein
MDAQDFSPETTERANELYWGSERSVNQLADDLDLSKGALYGLIHPLPAGLGCPVCGSEVVYSNRTAKERGRLDCPTCDWEGAADEAAGETFGEETTAVTGPLSRSRDSGDRYRTIAGGALLGAAAGLALVFWARRRS